MKISKIHIHDYFQFQDLELDLTYPKGHEKEGQALDKVCLIGQSGTGKTTILEMIRTTIQYTDLLNTATTPRFINFQSHQGVTVFFKDSAGKDYPYTTSHNGTNELGHSVKDFTEIATNALFYFPSNLPAFLPEKQSYEGIQVQSKKELNNLSGKKISYYTFDKEGLDQFWNWLSLLMLEDQLNEADFRVELTKIIEESEDEVNYKKRIEEWKAIHPNPVEKIAMECLNPFLNRFHLTVKTEIDSFRKADFIQIKSLLNGKVIPYEKLSSGTRQILYTALPLYEILSKDSIVLMDECGNSLYPDIQKEIINYYTSFDKEKQSQFFFATHSPIIASSFEPWEIVELKFDAEGKIYRELYYEGENHVDNYRIDPRYLRWDQILTKVFDMETDSNEKREEKLIEFAILKREIEHLEREGKLENQTKEIQNLVEKFMQVGNQLEWETDKYLAHAENQ